MSVPRQPYQQLVASVARAMQPDAVIDEGCWVEGPDGERDLDVTIRGNLAGRDAFVLIECKDWRRRVGVQVIDALDSKRRDLTVTHAIVCSNSGFSAQALRKAKRVGIGTVSAVMQGDDRVRLTIDTEVYCGKVQIARVQCTYRGNDLGSLPRGITDRQVFCAERPLAAWFRDRLSWFINQYPTFRALRIETEFRAPIDLSFAGVSRSVIGYSLQVEYSTTWYGKVVSIDASAGLYDYLSGTMNIEPTGKYHLNDMSYPMGNGDDRWERVDFVPTAVTEMASLARGDLPLKALPLLGMEVKTIFYVVTGIDTADDLPAPDLNAHVASERVEARSGAGELVRVERVP